jgi:hypothetical protein
VLAAALLVLSLVACRGFLSDESSPVALQVIAPPESLAVGDTAAITAEALNRSGEVIPGAPMFLVSLDPDTIGVSAAGLAVVGLQPGPGEVLVGTGNLRSAPFRIIVYQP